MAGNRHHRVAILALAHLAILLQIVRGQFNLGAEVMVTEPPSTFVSTEPADIDLGNPYIESFFVNSAISSGFAQTSQKLTIVNNGGSYQNVRFFLYMPHGALINNYTVSTYEPSNTYTSDEYRRIFNFEVTERSSQARIFDIDISIPGYSSVLIELTYEELLRRMDGRYQYNLYLKPGQLAERMYVSVGIDDHVSMSSLNSIWESADEYSSIKAQPAIIQNGVSRSIVTFDLTARQQLAESSSGLDGNMMISYEVAQGVPSGSITMYSRYFLHRINPRDLLPLDRQVTFLVDVGSSMAGLKLEQVQLALEQAIDTMSKSDSFNVIAFSDMPIAWHERMYKASSKNKEEAIDFVRGLRTRGETDLLNTIEMMLATQDITETGYQTIFLFTDGIISQPIENIIGRINALFGGRVVLYIIGLGPELVGNDYYYRRMVLDNNGVYKLVIPTAESYIEISTFLMRYWTPMMYNVEVVYPEAVVDIGGLTKHISMTFYDGQDLIVAGRLRDDFSGSFSMLDALVSYGSQGGFFEVGLNTPIVTREDRAVEDFAERTWKFLTLKRKLGETNFQTGSDMTKRQNEAYAMAERFEYLLDRGSIPPENIVDRGDIVRGDPHIIIHDPNSELRVCFDIHGTEGTVVNLLDDPDLGIIVNGEMVEKFNFTSTNPNKPTPSFFGRIAVNIRGDWVTLSRDGVTFNDDLSMNWTRRAAFQIGTCKLRAHSRNGVTIQCPDGITMKVLRHRVSVGHSDHFDFHLANGGEFSPQVDGIIGQFQRRPMQILESSLRKTKSGKEKALLSLDGEANVPVFMASRRRTGPCWTSYVHQGLPMLERDYEQYILPELFSMPSFD